MTILLNQRRTQQPAYVAEVDWDNPITRGLVYCSPGNDPSKFNLVSARQVPTAAGMAYGLGATLGFGASDSLTTTLTAHATQRTYFIRVRPLSAGGGGLARLFDKRVTSTEAELLFYSGGSAIMYKRVFTSGWLEGNWNTPGLVSGSVAVSYDSSSLTNAPVLYINGVDQGFPSAYLARPSGGVPLDVPDNYVLGNRRTDNARNFDGIIGEFFVFDRILAGHEIRSLSDNPWQIFRAAVS